MTEIEIDCLHKETINADLVGICGKCGQERQYSDQPSKKPEIIKHGSIDGVLTRIVPLNSKTPVLEPEEVTLEEEAPVTEEPIAEVEEAAPLLETIERLPAPGVASEAAPAGHKPDNWDEMARMQKHAWYEEHKDAIIQDALTIGVDATLVAWDIPSGTYQRLRERWPKLPGDLPTSATSRKVSATGRRRKRGTQKGRWASYEKNKALMVSDYYTMPIVLFYRKWHISPDTWTDLKKLWGVVGKRPRVVKEPPIPTEVPAAAEEVTPQDQVEEITAEVPWHPTPLTKRTGNRGAWSF